MEVPLNHPFIDGFPTISIINQPTIGVLPFMETPICLLCSRPTSMEYFARCKCQHWPWSSAWCGTRPSTAQGWFFKMNEACFFHIMMVKR